MKTENKTFLLYTMTLIVGLLIIIVLSKINIKIANMYPDVSSVILGVHGIGIVVGILIFYDGVLLGLLISNVIKHIKGNVKRSKAKNEQNDMDI